MAGDGQEVPLPRLPAVERDPHLRPRPDIERRRGEAVHHPPAATRTNAPCPFFLRDLLPDGEAPPPSANLDLR
ncbi:MAG: hypothetical protein ACOX0O_11565 [Candidatus Methanoculleus thermohydrogenotrophicum]